MVALTALYLGSRISAGVGEGVFYGFLAAGWMAVLVWTFIAWRRGEKVFIWQSRGS
jgi:hypothetical protein